MIHSYEPSLERMVFILSKTRAVNIRHLSFAYQKGKDIIHNLSLSLPQGQFILLVGPTGCGKSTLLKLIAGLYPKYAGASSGKIETNLSRALMFQNPSEQFTMATPRQEIIFALENLRLDHPSYEKRLKKAVVLTQISRLLDQKIATLSGGERQRVALAVLIAMNVDLFLLDEPFASVDPASRHFLIQQLTKLRDQGKTIILSDHVLTDYDQVCDQVYQFKGTSLQELGSTEKKKLFQTSQAKSDYHFDQLKNSSAVFTLKNTQIKQNRLLLKQDQLLIPQGKSTLITGPNGIGKTSFFKALTKMIPYQGQLLFHDQEIARLKERHYLKKVAQIFQHADDQFLKITAAEEIALSKTMRNPFFTDEEIKKDLRALKLDTHLKQVVYSLSGGQKKELQILLMLITSHEVLLIDEPLSGLDHEAISCIVQLMKRYQEATHTTFLIISHQVGALADLCSYHLAFKEQKLTYESTL